MVLHAQDSAAESAGLRLRRPAHYFYIIAPLVQGRALGPLLGGCDGKIGTVILKVEKWEKMWLTSWAVQRQVENGVKNEPLSVGFG